MNKNDIVTFNITDYTAEGLGVGKYNGIAVFVPQTAIGDTVKVKIVKVKPNFAYGVVLENIKPSSDRINNDCMYFGKCGGCVFRHIDYAAELEFKKQRVYESIKRIGGIDMPCREIVGSKFSDCYRNKAQFPFSPTCEVGFFAPRSHRVIPIKNCLLLPDKLNRIAEYVSDFIEEKQIPVYNEETGEGLVKHLYLRQGAISGEIMVVLVINGDDMPYSDVLTDKLLYMVGNSIKSIQLNINKKRNNVILGDKNIVLYGDSYITDTLCGIKVRLSPFTFYQVNHNMAEKLYKKATEYANPIGKSVIDLYCGAGTIGLQMANQAKKIIGVEIVPEAVKDAKKNAYDNGIENAEFICGDAKFAAEQLAANNTVADVIILDPPRKGCAEELLHTVANGFSPQTIVYVSCDPATLARDIKILNSLGYTLKDYTVFDMFPRTAHVETVCLLCKQ
ncbi:MAG: 23S rRNA (uracil(1939)-C(5))-methyltransferase RlmD [Clostridia bacterium]|nr:23S rRNA (uracil(1939)-C(5))-methyltransferase RlmD [Clostridia bacterium]